jgi:indole-3-glycerol phosphate synthase
MGVLDEIVANKRSELASLRGQRLPEPPELRTAVLRRGPGEPLRLIAEIKRRSPSAGVLSTKLEVGERARAYERAGANMVSVLCDSRFFDGAYEHLRQARRACSLPILCKEFVIDEVQLDFARAYGADAVLLIVRCIAEPELPRLIRAARERHLEPLVEIATENESALALDAGATLIGVNARNLDTLHMDVNRVSRILMGLPAGITALHLSGLSEPDAVRKVAASRAAGALIGEALMRQDDPEPLLRAMVEAARG